MEFSEESDCCDVDFNVYATMQIIDEHLDEKQVADAIVRGVARKRKTLSLPVLHRSGAVLGRGLFSKERAEEFHRKYPRKRWCNDQIRHGGSAGQCKKTSE